MIGLLQNPIFIAPALGWFLAQGIKTILYVLMNHEFRADRLCGSGGMPSSHSSTVCALCAATYFRCGVSGFEFPMALFFAIVVMYDAMGVRRETGEQAKVINEMVASFWDMGQTFDSVDPMNQLKELVGHTPLQVLVGAILGIATGSLVSFLM